MPGRVWPAAWRDTMGFALTHPPVLLISLCFPRQLFPQNQKASRRLDPQADLISPDLHHHDAYIIPDKNLFFFFIMSRLTWHSPVKGNPRPVPAFSGSDSQLIGQGLVLLRQDVGVEAGHGQALMPQLLLNVPQIAGVRQ
jgi:hypothetical protein